MLGCSEIREIDQDLATAFLSASSTVTLSSGSEPATLVLNLGAFEDEELIALARFAYPTSEALKSLYSVEVFALAREEGYESSIFVELLEAFVREREPNDVVILDILAEHFDLSTSGFALSADLKELGVSAHSWIHPERTYYTYNITAGDSDKYYYGVSHLKLSNASRAQCLEHNYWGSGSVRFQNWKSKHSDTLKKEVLQVFHRKALAYRAEEELVGDFYISDSNCLNSVRGGLRPFHVTKLGEMALCEFHGQTMHTSTGLCRKCASTKVFSTSFCDTHGLTVFRSDYCDRCRYESSRKTGICESHGSWSSTSGCSRCAAESALSVSECEIHGATMFRGSQCARCNSASMYSKQTCAIHGEVAFQDGSCVSCRVARMTTQEVCELHGETVHQGGTCRKCASSTMHHEATCEIHGQATFRGDYCLRCVNSRNFEELECSKHGLTTHHKGKCSRCHSESNYTERECEVHGLTKHQGQHCLRCKRVAEYSVEECEVHGEVKHRKGKCQKCAVAERKARRG